MKLFRLSWVAIVVLCLSIFGVLMNCADAGAAIRVGIFEMGLLDEDNMPSVNGSMSSYKKYEKLQKRYNELFMSELSQMGAFEAIELKFDIQDYQRESKSATGKRLAPRKQATTKSREYRPNFTRSMTKDTDIGSSNGMEQYINLRVNKARREKCRYAIDGSVRFDKSSNKEIKAHVTLSVFDAEKGEMVHFIGTGNSSPSLLRKTSMKSKKNQNSESGEQVLKEQAAVEAFGQALVRMLDGITGNSAKVADVKVDSVIINKGATSKVKAGDAYIVQADTLDGMDDVFGAAPTTSMMNIALIRVNNVQENSSTAGVVEGGGNINVIRAGDKLMPISDVDYVLSAVASGQLFPFPTSRPEIKLAEVKTPTSSKITAKLEPLPALPPGIIRVGVMNFENKADGISNAEASTLTDLLSRMLSNSDKIAVLERDRLEAVAREQKLNIAGVIDPETAARIGKLAGCQYMLLGSVTGLQENEFIAGRYIDPEANRKRRDAISKIGGRAGQILAGLELLGMIANAGKENVVVETHEIVTNVDARLVDVATSQITAAFSEQGSAAQSDRITQDMDGAVKDVEANYGSLESKAIASAAANLSHKIRTTLTGEQVQITSVNGDEIIVNRGSASGVQTGDLFCVYSEGQSGGDTEAIISVTDVQEAFSTAELAKSTTDSYSPAPGYRLDSVSHGDFQRGIWHIKNQRRAQATEEAKASMSISDFANSLNKRKRFETSSTDPKRVIGGYKLDAKKEKALLGAHSKASKESSAKKKYEAYKRLSEADMNDYLAAYNAGKYALELSKYAEAREFASKAVFVNPKYKPALELIEKIDKE